MLEETPHRICRHCFCHVPLDGSPAHHSPRCPRYSNPAPEDTEMSPEMRLAYEAALKAKNADKQ